MRTADALGVARLLAAAALPGAMSRALDGRGDALLPLLLFCVAAATDFFDGIVARRVAGGPTAHGAILDNLADVAFVMAGTATAAALGLVPVAAPLAIAVSVSAYVLASVRRSSETASVSLARSRLGHAAGVLNYALVGLVAIALAWGARWEVFLWAAGVVVAAVNLAAVARRLVPSARGAAATTARAPRGGGTPGRSARSSP
jgi:phosphatidylglycerophosphate synthase